MIYIYIYIYIYARARVCVCVCVVDKDRKSHFSDVKLYKNISCKKHFERLKYEKESILSKEKLINE